MRTSITGALLLVAGIAARTVVGCGEGSDEGLECTRNAECGDGEECTDGRCVAPDGEGSAANGAGSTSAANGATTGAVGSGGAAATGAGGAGATAASTSGVGGSRPVDPLCIQFASVWCGSCIPTPAADCVQTITDECDLALDLDDIGDCQGSIHAQYQCIVSTQCASITACSDCNAFPGCYPSYCDP